MRKNALLACLLLSFIFLLSFANISGASEDYIGVKEDDEFIWTVMVDADAYEDMLDDMGLGPTAAVDGYEDNDDFASAATLVAGTYLNLDVIDTDDDWYRVMMAEDEELNVLIEFDGDSSDIELEIYDDVESYEDGSFGVDDDEECCICADYDGYYYIFVENTDNIEEPYDMTITISTTCDCEEDYEFDFEDIEDYVGFKMIIDDIDDEEDYGSFEGVLVEVEFYYAESPNDWEELDLGFPGDFPLLVPNPDEADIWSSLITGFYLIIPLGLDWDEMAADANDAFDGGIDAEMTAKSNGFSFIMKDTPEDIECNVEYNEKGVLKLAKIEYGGVLLAELKLRAVIPGFPIIVLFGVSAVSIIGLTIIYKKKYKR